MGEWPEVHTSNYQCNYEGFTCKSNLTDCADEYDRLLNTKTRRLQYRLGAEEIESGDELVPQVHA